MSRGLVARAASVINAPIARVWDALTNPDMIRRYMFGTTVVSDWKEGSSIVWKGEWQGREYEDKGVIMKLVPGRAIRYSHFSPLSGLPDSPENYHDVDIELSGDGAQTAISLAQGNNTTEQDREHSQKNWEMMLKELKRLLEN